MSPIGVCDVQTVDRVKKIEDLGFVWDRHEFDWTNGYEHLKAYKERNGDCLVETKHETDDGYKLGIWCSDQRQRFKARRLADDRIAKLNALGFDWGKAKGSNKA
ncbi:MAG: helicase associated domain-containing protein [Rhodospirillaceae bacterium]|nr:helicase associated domain-containing protein [Rhodospirillaceae bacterium]